MTNVETSPTRRIEKPIGVYIITAFDFLVLGLLPLGLTIWLSRSPELELPFISIVLSITLAILIMATSVWAVVGDNPARYVLLGLVTVSSLLMIISNVTVMSADEIEGAQKIRLPAEKFGRDLVINESDVATFERRKAGRPPKLKEDAEKSVAKKRIRKKDPTRLLKTLS